MELSNILGHIEAIELIACACKLLPEVDACGLNSQACQLIEHTNHINVATQFCVDEKCTYKLKEQFVHATSIAKPKKSAHIEQFANKGQ